MENRRAGEKKGRKLSPGERAKNWAGAAVTLWPILVFLLGLLGYTNADKITALAQPDGNTEIVNQNFEEQVQKFSQETVKRFEAQQKQIQQANKRISRLEDKAAHDDSGLQSQINANRELICGWHSC